MKINRSFFIFLTSFCIFGCQHSPEKKQTNIHLPKSEVQFYNSKKTSEQYNDIDIPALIEELKMNTPIEKIGYQEKAFDTCSIESNRSSAPLCQKLYLSHLNYQVMCRESTGTVNKVNLTPLSTQAMRWRSPGKRGYTKTNQQGYGQVGFISSNPASASYLYFYLGSKIARKRFSDQWKLILPKNWCQHR